jgi:hypothetical protein
MNIKKTMLALAATLGMTAAVLGFAEDPNVGSWKLNEAKSKIASNVARNVTVNYTAVGDSYKCVVDGVDAAGKPSHNEWTGKFDGKDYPVTGDPLSDTRSVKLVKPGHYVIGNKKAGKATLDGTVDFSSDQKTRTLITRGTDAAGKKTTATAVYERQ